MDETRVQVVFVNLRDHDINIIRGEEVVRLAPSRTLAKIEYDLQPAGDLNGIPCYQDGKARVVGIPPEVEGIYYIVSRRIFDFLSDRHDLLIPNMSSAVRNHKGELLGVTGFIRR